IHVAGTRDTRVHGPDQTPRITMRPPGNRNSSTGIAIPDGQGMWSTAWDSVLLCDSAAAPAYRSRILSVNSVDISEPDSQNSERDYFPCSQGARELVEA